MVVISPAQAQLMDEHAAKEMAKAKAAMPEVFELMEQVRADMRKAMNMDAELGRSDDDRRRDAINAMYAELNRIHGELAKRIADYLARNHTPPPILIEKESSNV